MFVAYGHYAGLGGVEERAVFDADYVGRNDLIFGVAVRFVGGSFHRGVDFFFGYRAFEDGNQFGQRAGGNGDALGGAVEFAVQFGDNQTDGFGGAGAVGHDVKSGGAGAAQIAFAVRRVKGVLVAGVGVDGGHQAFDYAELFLQDCRHRGEAVGGAGSGGDDGFAAIQNVLVHAIYDGFHVIAAGGGNNDFARTGADVGFGFGFAGKEAGTFEDDVYAQFAPRQFFRIRIGEDFDFFAVHYDGIVFQFGSTLEAALGAVVFEKVQQHFGRGQVVDGDDFDAFGFFNLTQCQTADAAETVNRYFDAHFDTPVSRERDKFQ